MRKLAVVLLMAALGSSVFAATPITIDQLEQLLSTSQGQSDAKVAEKIADLELTERVSSERLAKWQEDFPGKQTRDALVALADASAFLALPASEIPPLDAPDAARQEQILAHANTFVKFFTSRLPALTVRRSTVLYDDLSAVQQLYNKERDGVVGGTASGLSRPTQFGPLRVAEQSARIVTYVRGEEKSDATPAGDKKAHSETSVRPPNWGLGLTPSGEFGPVLAMVVNDALKSEIAWNHWEKDPGGPLAVFSYSVPQQKSNYIFTNGKAAKPQPVAYRGEIAVAPESGAVMRLTLVADMKPQQAHAPTSGMGAVVVYGLSRSAIAVEYAPVGIGNDTCICPQKGLALSTQVPLSDLPGSNSTTYRASSSYSGASVASRIEPQKRLSDVTFTDYRELPAETDAAGNGAGTNTAPPSASKQREGGCQPVTIDQLEQFLSSNHTQSDAALAKKLATFELTERATTTRLLLWRSQFPGKRTQQALTALAGESAFLDLPAADIPPTPKPAHDEMQQIMLRAIDYTNTTIHKLPNFTARRNTTYFDNLEDVRRELLWFFEERTRLHQGGGPVPGAENRPASSVNPEEDHALRPALNASPLKTSRETSTLITYRDGQEVLVTHAFLDTQPTDPIERDKHTGLTTYGEFGPILTTVMGDASHGRVTWSHWEQGTGGPLAVYRYTVPKEFARFTVLGFADSPELPAYHGELSVDPASGTILRITVVSDWQPPYQDHESKILVEYGSVLIGESLYTCPVHGVAVTRVPESTADYGVSGRYNLPAQIFVNDISFTQYHLFRGDVRILSDDGSSSQPNNPPSSPN